jgi:putative membrane protein
LASAAALAACSHNGNAGNDQANTMVADDSLMANNMTANDMTTDNMMADNMTGNDMAANSAAATPTTAAGFIAAAGASDMFEIQSAKLALANSKSDDIHKFAQMMIADHTKTTDAVKAAAKKAGITPAPPQLTAEQQQMLDQLKPLKGDDFDKAYLAQQMPAHQQALALIQNYAQNGDTPALVDAAKSAVPIVQKHIDHLQELQK